MLTQSIPFFVIALILGIAIVRRKKTSAFAFFTLGTIALCFFCSIFLYLRPRTGRPFVDLEAMIFLGLTYGLFCLPLLFMKKGTPPAVEADGERCELTEKTFLSLAAGLIVLTLPVALYDLWIGGKALLTFATTDGTREALRRAQVGSTRGLLKQFCFCLESFSYCALFLSAVGLVWFPKYRFVNTLLMIGGSAPMLWSYSRVARNVALQEGLFYMLAILTVATLQERNRFSGRRLFANPTFVLFVFLASFPFVLITALRFMPAFAPSAYKKKAPVKIQQAPAQTKQKEGPARAQQAPAQTKQKKAPVVQKEVVYRRSNEEGLLYSSYSYFCTGPYSFNADYVARYEKGFPCFRGGLTAGPVVKVIDILTGSRITKDAADLYTAVHLAPRTEYPKSIYVDISDAYSGEFKTMVGHICYDYPKWGAFLFCVSVAFFAFLVFWKMDANCLAYKLFATLYINTLIYGLMLWPWRSVRQGLILFWLLAFVFFLWWLKKRSLRVQ